MRPDAFGKVEIRSSGDLHNWLQKHHGQKESIWLVTWKAQWPERYVSRDAVLDALIAYGWVDGRRMKLDDERTMQLISPRKQQIWAKTYKERAARLEAEGRMRPPGLASMEQSKAAGLWDTLADVDRLEDPADLIQALKARNALAWWKTAAPSYRRNILRWIASAKRAPTRTKRIAIATDHAARAEKVPHC